MSFLTPILTSINHCFESYSISKQKFLISIDKESWLKELKNSSIKLDDDIITHLYQQYGKGALKILEIIKEDDSYKERIMKENDFIKAEIIYCLRYELTRHLIDIFCRRTEMSLWISHKKAFEAAEKVVDLMAKEFNWNEEKKTQEINIYLNYIKETVSFIQ